MRPLLLVGFAEALSAPEVVFGLEAAGFRIRLFTRAGTKSRLAKALKLELVDITPPEQDTAAARRDLIRACDGVDGLFALDDVSLRLFNDIADQTGTAHHIHATGAQAEIALNKEEQLVAARAVGLDVPDGPIIRKPSDLPEKLKTPAIAKPVMAVEEIGGRLTKGDVHYLMTQQDVAAFRKRAALDSPLIVQPLIHGTGEGVFGFATPEGVTHWSGHRRIRMMNPHGSGSSACEVMPPEADMRNRVETMMMTLGWRGPFMVELLRDEDGADWFMELNGRVWGSMALARRNGLDYPVWAAEVAFDKEFKPERGPQRRHMVRHLGREILHMVFLLRGPKTAFHRQNWPKWYVSLAGVLKPTSLSGFYNYDPSHRSFFLSDAWATVTAVLRKRRD